MGTGGRLLVVAVGLLSALAVAFVVFNHALALQLLGAAVGAILLTGGFALARAGWPRRRRSEAHRLAVASGFLLCSIGVFLISAGIGLYH